MLSFLFISLAASAQDQVLVWSDEFDVDGPPNPANWNYDSGNGSGGWGNNELESYTSKPANVRVSDGLLLIDAIKTGGNWTSGRIKTQGKATFTYGKIQFRAKLPTGSGTWPALWLLGASVESKGWPSCGEIDVLEHVGKNPGVAQSAIHTPSSFGNTVNKGSTNVSTFSTAFHDYELTWTAEKLQFSVDGRIAYYTYQPNPRNAASWPFDNPQFLIVNLAMGGNLGSDPQFETNGLKNGVDPALTFAEMQVDYIRVYQSIGNLLVTGPAIVEKNQTNLKYKFSKLPGATYLWTVPADAQITGGAGTNEITVAWGQTEGNVALSVTTEGKTFDKSLAVTQVTKPQGSVFPLRSADFSIMWANNLENGNQYPIASQAPLQTNYTVATKLTLPALVGSFSRALDLTEYPVLRVSAKTFNKSKTVNMRMDLIDLNGRSTSSSPVFNFTPLIDDGEYYKYSFNYGDVNGWKGPAGAVNSSAISKINFFIDYGAGGGIGADSVWVDSLWVEKPTVAAVPNRPSHIAAVYGAGFAVSWNDNSTDETGFKIYRASAAHGPYSEVHSVNANLTSATLDAESTNPALFYYRVRAVNAAGLSDFSNTLNPTDVITGIENINPGTDFFPNPTTGIIHLNLTKNTDTMIRVRTVFGTEIFRLQTPLESATVDLSECARGIYLLEVNSANRISVGKLILQ